MRSEKRTAEQATENALQTGEKVAREVQRKIAPQIQQSIQENMEGVNKNIEHTVQKAVKNYMRQYMNQKDRNLERRIKENIKKQKELLRDKDIVTNYTIFYQRALKKKGFNYVVTGWRYKSSEDTVPYQQNCFMSQNKTTFDLAIVEKGATKPKTLRNKSLYKKYKINKKFEDKARRLCLWHAK